MNICLVGSILRHTIHSDAGTYSGWGGQTESAVAPFAALLNANDSTIRFVGSVGASDIREVKEFYRKHYPIVDRSGIFINPAGTDHHVGTKHFVTRKIQVEPTRFEHIEPYLKNAHVVIFNFGNIDDIDPEAIRQVKQSTDAPVYVDVHRKPFGADREGRMHARGWKGWERYLGCADHVQMDRNECETLFGKKLKTIGDAATCARAILDAGAKHAIITLGNRGALLAHREHGYRYLHAPVLPANVIDTTGAGDAFAAGYLVRLHEGGSIPEALTWGSLMAAINCEYKGYITGLTRTAIEKRVPGNFPIASANPSRRTLL